MSLVEPIEARRLCAATSDVSFATGGHLSLSVDYAILNMLATHGEIYVQAYQRTRERSVILKYTDSGVLDTSWGRGGYIGTPLPVDRAGNQSLDTLTMVRDHRTGGLLVGAVGDTANAVTVRRYTAGGTLDAAWGNGGLVTYSERKTALSLPRVIALPHKRVLLALGREQQLGTYDDYYGRRDGASDVALLKFDPRGRYDRAFNSGHALTVATGNYHAGNSVIDEDNVKRFEDYTVPTFGDIQFFNDDSFRVVSMREETHQTTNVFNIDVSTTVGRSVFSAESTVVTANGTVRSKRSQSYVLKRGVMTDTGTGSTDQYRPLAAAASADGVSIAVLADTYSASGESKGGSLLRVGPGYRSRPERLPAPLDTRYLNGVHRSGDGTVSVQSAGVNSPPDDDKPHEGPGILSLGRDLAVGRHRVILPPTYFPGFSVGVYTFDDKGRLLAEDTNLDTNTFEITRYV